MSELPFHRLVVEKHSGATVTRLTDRSPRDVAVVQQIGEELCRLAREPAGLLVVDFREVEFFEANLRAQLVRVYREMTVRGGRLAVCHLPPGMKEQFAALRFDRLVSIVDTLEEALTAAARKPIFES